MLSSTEPIPETSAAEELVADALAINASPEHAERVRDSVPLWFHTFALAPGIYTPGIACARFGITLSGAAGFGAIAGLTGSRVEYHQMEGLDVGDLGERFDVVLCFGILHRVTDPRC